MTRTIPRLLPLDKALGDLPKPRQSVKDSRFTSQHDYTNMLPSHLQQQGYEMVVLERKSPLGNRTLDSAIMHPVDGSVAHVYGYIHNDKGNKIRFINPHANGVHPNHQGNKLGFHAYEAMLNHAYNQLGVTQMKPGQHSGFAEKVHRALAAKHGFQILKPATVLPHAHPYDVSSAHPSLPDTRVMITHDESAYGLGDNKVPMSSEHTNRIQSAWNRIRNMWHRGEQWLGLD